MSDLLDFLGGGDSTSSESSSDDEPQRVARAKAKVITPAIPSILVPQEGVAPQHVFPQRAAVKPLSAAAEQRRQALATLQMSSSSNSDDEEHMPPPPGRRGMLSSKSATHSRSRAPAQPPAVASAVFPPPPQHQSLFDNTPETTEQPSFDMFMAAAASIASLEKATVEAEQHVAVPEVAPKPISPPQKDLESLASSATSAVPTGRSSTSSSHHVLDVLSIGEREAQVGSGNSAIDNRQLLLPVTTSGVSPSASPSVVTEDSEVPPPPPSPKHDALDHNLPQADVLDVESVTAITVAAHLQPLEVGQPANINVEGGDGFEGESKSKELIGVGEADALQSVVAPYATPFSVTMQHHGAVSRMTIERVERENIELKATISRLHTELRDALLDLSFLREADSMMHEGDASADEVAAIRAQSNTAKAQWDAERHHLLEEVAMWKRRASGRRDVVIPCHNNGGDAEDIVRGNNDEVGRDDVDVDDFQWARTHYQQQLGPQCSVLGQRIVRDPINGGRVIRFRNAATQAQPSTSSCGTSSVSLPPTTLVASVTQDKYRCYDASSQTIDTSISEPLGVALALKRPILAAVMIGKRNVGVQFTSEVLVPAAATTVPSLPTSRPLRTIGVQVSTTVSPKMRSVGTNTASTTSATMTIRLQNGIPQHPLNTTRPQQQQQQQQLIGARSVAMPQLSLKATGANISLAHSTIPSDAVAPHVEGRASSRRLTQCIHELRDRINTLRTTSNSTGAVVPEHFGVAVLELVRRTASGETPVHHQEELHDVPQSPQTNKNNEEIPYPPQHGGPTCATSWIDIEEVTAPGGGVASVAEGVCAAPLTEDITEQPTATTNTLLRQLIAIMEAKSKRHDDGSLTTEDTVMSEQRHTPPLPTPSPFPGNNNNMTMMRCVEDAATSPSRPFLLRPHSSISFAFDDDPSHQQRGDDSSYLDNHHSQAHQQQQQLLLWKRKYERIKALQRRAEDAFKDSLLNLTEENESLRRELEVSCRPRRIR